MEDYIFKEVYFWREFKQNTTVSYPIAGGRQQNSVKNFNQSNHYDRTASSEATFDIDGTNSIQSQTSMQIL